MGHTETIPCDCCCPEYTAYVRSGFGSNGVATYSGNQDWEAQTGPNLAGSVWIWSAPLVQNPTQDEYFYLSHQFNIPYNWNITSAIFYHAADNSANISINGVPISSSDDTFLSPDGISTNIPVTSLLRGTGFLNEISGTITNVGVSPSPDFEPTPFNNPAGIIYTLVYTYTTCTT